MPQYLSLAESHIPYTSQYFHISVGSATYDRYDLCFVLVLGLVGFSSDLVFRIEKDIRVTTEAALGLIGGTMGLFTGHSIITLAASHLTWGHMTSGEISLHGCVDDSHTSKLII